MPVVVATNENHYNCSRQLNGYKISFTYEINTIKNIDNEDSRMSRLCSMHYSSIFQNCPVLLAFTTDYTSVF